MTGPSNLRLSRTWPEQRTSSSPHSLTVTHSDRDLAVSQPMPTPFLRDTLSQGKPVFGPILQEIPSSPELVEFIIAAGFDYVIIDGEHGGVSVEVVRSLVRAAESMGGCALARVAN